MPSCFCFLSNYLKMRDGDIVILLSPVYNLSFIPNTVVIFYWVINVHFILQINRKMEFVFASHSFDVWENWALEGSLQECRLVNCRNSSVSFPCYLSDNSFVSFKNFFYFLICHFHLVTLIGMKIKIII